MMESKKKSDKKRKKKHIIKMETKISLGAEKAEFNLDKKRAAIKAALHAATAGLAAATSGLAGQVADLEAGDGGTPPWGEVIIGPIWEQRNPEFGNVLLGAAEITFWE